MNTLTTKHVINYKGKTFIIKGKHELKFATCSKMEFTIYLENAGINIGKFGNLKWRMDFLLEAAVNKASRDRQYEERRALTIEQIITHVDFAYARFQSSTFGNYYNLYMCSVHSPTGIELVNGCDEQEWERISKAAGKTNQYLSPTEGRKNS